MAIRSDKHHSRYNSLTQRIFYPSFDGGLNLSVPSQSLAKNELKEALNVEFSPLTGAMKTRGGLVWSGRFSSSVDFVIPVKGRRGFLARTKGARTLHYFRWNNIWPVQGTLSGSGDLSIAAWGDSEFVIASGGKLQLFTDSGLPKIETLPNSPSNCRFVFVRNGRVGVVSGDDTITFSHVGDCTQWDNNPDDESTGQFIEIGYKDGMNINAIVPLSRDLIIFKSPDDEPDKGTIWRLVGDFPEWQVVEAAHNTGTFNNRTVQAVGDDVFYITLAGVATLSSVTAYGEVKTSWPDRKIINALTPLINYTAQLWDIPAKQQLWLLPSENASDIWVLDYIRGIWTKFSFPKNPIHATGVDNRLYIFIDDDLYEVNDNYIQDEMKDSGKKTIEAYMKLGTILTGRQTLIKGVYVSFEIQPQCSAELILGKFKMPFTYGIDVDYIYDAPNDSQYASEDDDVTVLPYIKEILESAEYIGSRNIEAKRTSYILAKPLLYDGQRFIMLMVVNEDTQGKKYYDHEFTTIKKIDGLPTVLRKSKTTEGGQNHQSLLSILAEDVWFNNASKVVDENGEPLVMYHGTNENFSIFEHDKIGESSGDYGYSGYGFYFTPNEGEAWMYGTIKMPVFLNIKNPFRCDFADLEKYSNILSFDENDKNNIIDKEKLISALESKSPVAKDFFQELEKNGYEKACENIMQKYSDEEIKQSPIDFNNVVEYWEYAQGKIEVPYYVAEDIIAELGEDIIKREYVETPHLKELLNYGKDKSQTQEFIKALKQDGYDGVIYGDEHVIFNSEQAKSATDNTGTFNSNNPDIYYQAFSPRKSLIQRLKDWIKGKGIEERERLFSSADATNNTDYSFDNEESERRWEEAKKGIQQPTAPQCIKRATLNLLRSFRGDYPELAGNKEFNFAREAFRKLGRAKSTQVHKSMKTFTENLGKLSKRQLDLFARKRLLDDLMWRKQQVPDAELPFGFTDESLKKEYEKFTKIAESDKAVMKAIHDEEQTMQAISKEFADLAGKLGLNLDKVFKNPHYFRHSILEYANAAAVGTKNGKSSQNTEITNNGSLQNAINSKLNDIRNRSFLKKYKGSNLDINMNYAQAMGEVRAQMLMDIETMKTLLEIKEHYDKAPELREALKKAFTPLKGKNESHNQGDGVKLSEIIPEGYTLYNPAGSRLIQSANTTAENVLAMAIDDASEESGLPLDEIINSMGTTGEEFFNQLWIIPKEIKETLRKMSKGRDRGLLGNTARVITRGWKKLVLFSPTRNLKYNFRNFTGDLDAVIAGNPSALKFFGQSVKELTAYFTGKEITQDLKDYMERSGGMEIESMSFSDNEVKELQSLAEILKDKSSSIPKKGWNLIKKFFANEVAFTQWREHLLRYAAYLAYKQDMDANNGIPSTWGASIKDEVMSLDNVMTRSLNDNRDKAYKMSNELLGAYDQVSDTGKQLRETLIPFYSWMEVNMRRYYRLLKNGFSGQNSSDFTKRLLLGQTAIVPFYALSIAETTAKIAALTLAVQMFNRMFFGDDDDKLPNDVKYRPHLTLGEIGGKVYYFDRIGALADATDWLSLDSIFLDAKELINGQQSIGGYLKKIAQAPVNKIINGLNPILKMPIELATGRTMYPDAFNSRTIRDNEKYIAQSLGLAWPYKALVTGEPRNDWDELSRMLIYSLDPDEAAYFQTLDKVRQFQERVLDKKFDGFATTRRGKVLQNLKRALRYKDKAAIRRYLKEYAKVDGTKKGLQQSMKAMSPLFGLSKDEKKQFLKWITADDRKYLRRADKYFRELTSRFLR